MHSIYDTALITSDEIPRDVLRDRVIIRFGLTPAAVVVNSPRINYCITFTPHFVSEDFNTLNTPSFDGALHIEIVESFFLFNFKSLIFLYFFY